MKESKFIVSFEVKIKFDEHEMTEQEAIEKMKWEVYFPCEDQDDVFIIEQKVIEEPEYRLLTKDDTIQKGDEYKFPDGWKPVPMMMYGDKFNAECDNNCIRRKI